MTFVTEQTLQQVGATKTVTIDDGVISGSGGELWLQSDSHPLIIYSPSDRIEITAADDVAISSSVNLEMTSVSDLTIETTAGAMYLTSDNSVIIDPGNGSSFTVSACNIAEMTANTIEFNSSEIQFNGTQNLYIRDGYIQYDAGRRVEIMVSPLRAVQGDGDGYSDIAFTHSGTLYTTTTVFMVPLSLPRGCILREAHAYVNKANTTITALAVCKRSWDTATNTSVYLKNTIVSGSTGYMTISCVGMNTTITPEDQDVYYLKGESQNSNDLWGMFKIIIEVDQLSETTRG